MQKSKRGFIFGMSFPAAALLVLLSVFPLIFTIYYSFTDYYYLSKSAPGPVGLKNYFDILADPYFRQAVVNTILFTLLAVFFETVVGLLFAVILNSVKRMRKTLRMLILLPMLLPPVTVALIWQIMFSNNYGIINQLLGMVGLPAVNWLMDVKTAFYAILAIDIWQYVPFTFLLMYAALQSVPQGQYEAASIDGASVWKQFVYITLPNIAGSIIMVMLLRTIDTFRLFDKVNILTKGGPANTTATITQYIYQYGVKNLKVGYGGAASIMMTILVLLLAGSYIYKTFKDQKSL